MYISLINDLGNRVQTEANINWTSGRKKVSHSAKIELIEDYTKAQLLDQVINQGKEIYPKPNKPKGGILFPPMLICSLNKDEDPIAIYPDPTPETLASQEHMIENFANALIPLIHNKIQQKSDGFINTEKPVSIKKSKLQKLREGLHLTQSELSKRSGISLQIIKKYELPENNLKNAKGDILLALSKALKCSIETLLL